MADVYPNRNALHRYMAPPESCDTCRGRGWYPCGEEDDPREIYCECPAGQERRRVEAPESRGGDR